MISVPLPVDSPNLLLQKYPVFSACAVTRAMSKRLSEQPSYVEDFSEFDLSETFMCSPKMCEPPEDVKSLEESSPLQPSKMSQFGHVKEEKALSDDSHL